MFLKSLNLPYSVHLDTTYVSMWQQDVEINTCWLAQQQRLAKRVISRRSSPVELLREIEKISQVVNYRTVPECDTCNRGRFRDRSPNPHRSHNPSRDSHPKFEISQELAGIKLCYCYYTFREKARKCKKFDLSGVCAMENQAIKNLFSSQLLRRQQMVRIIQPSDFSVLPTISHIQAGTEAPQYFLPLVHWFRKIAH